MTSLAKRNITSTRKQKVIDEHVAFVIPSAGIGYRLKAVGPKSLIRLDGGLTILEHQLLTILRVYPNSEILYVVGFENYKFNEYKKKYPIRLIYNSLYDKTNVLYSIGLGVQATTLRKIVVVYGDLVFNSPTITNIHAGGSKVVIDTRQQISKEKVGVVLNKGVVTNFAYGVEPKWAQIAYLTGLELDLFEETALDNKKRGWYGHESLNYVIDNGGKLTIFESPDIEISEIRSKKDIP